MICCAVIDTNVLVSALLSSHDDAATVQVVRRLLMGEITPEYRDVLHRKKFSFPPRLVDELVAAVTKFGLRVEPAPSGVELPDSKDLPFYEVVLEKKDDGVYLVTGNLKHFPRQPFVVTARQMLDILDGRTE